MADPERFERPTPRFVVWCSIQLSYGSTVGGDLAVGVGKRKGQCQKTWTWRVVPQPVAQQRLLRH